MTYDKINLGVLICLVIYVWTLFQKMLILISVKKLPLLPIFQEMNCLMHHIYSYYSEKVAFIKIFIQKTYLYFGTKVIGRFLVVYSPTLSYLIGVFGKTLYFVE